MGGFIRFDDGASLPPACCRAFERSHLENLPAYGTLDLRPAPLDDLPDPVCAHNDERQPNDRGSNPASGFHGLVENEDADDELQAWPDVLDKSHNAEWQAA